MDKQAQLNAFKAELREYSGWPNVKAEMTAKAEAKREAEMLAAGARVAETLKRGPGRPPNTARADD